MARKKSPSTRGMSGDELRKFQRGETETQKTFFSRAFRVQQETGRRLNREAFKSKAERARVQAAHDAATRVIERARNRSSASGRGGKGSSGGKNGGGKFQKRRQPIEDATGTSSIRNKLEGVNALAAAAARKKNG